MKSRHTPPFFKKNVRVMASGVGDGDTHEMRVKGPCKRLSIVMTRAPGFSSRSFRDSSVR